MPCCAHPPPRTPLPLRHVLTCLPPRPHVSPPCPRSTLLAPGCATSHQDQRSFSIFRLPIHSTPNTTSTVTASTFQCSHHCLGQKASSPAWLPAPITHPGSGSHRAQAEPPETLGQDAEPLTPGHLHVSLQPQRPAVSAGLHCSTARRPLWPREPLRILPDLPPVTPPTAASSLLLL